MVSTKGYWDMINEHIIDSDLEYLETKNVEDTRKELKKNYLNKEELYKFEIYQLQKQLNEMQIRVKELNEEIWELKNEKTD
tara:strand:+ start:683 stop:925 length:243 start_codon:yes stop_codon:yes gene_type:complete